jgi:hypothetical protein
MASLAAREYWIGRHPERDARKHRPARQYAKISRLGAGQHKTNASHRSRPICIDVQTRVRMRRAHYHRVHGSRRRGICDIAAVAAQQRVVLLAHNRLAETEFHALHFEQALAPAGAHHLVGQSTCLGTASRPPNISATALRPCSDTVTWNVETSVTRSHGMGTGDTVTYSRDKRDTVA